MLNYIITGVNRFGSKHKIGLVTKNRCGKDTHHLMEAEKQRCTRVKHISWQRSICNRFMQLNFERTWKAADDLTGCLNVS